MNDRLPALPLLAAAVLLALPGCSDPKPPSSDDTCDPAARAVGFDCEDEEVLRAVGLLRAMTLEEKVQQMSGPVYDPNNMFDQEDNERLGIPGTRFMDGPRGVRWYNSDYGTTVYPVAAARASTWNLELERRIGRAMAEEMRHLGRHVLLAPTINQVMHPRWGRAQETYGEDTFLLGAMGSAFVKGAQHDPTVADPLDPSYVPHPDAYRIQACAKHFAANNIEDQRIYVNAVLDERTAREVYLPHFKRLVDEGVSVVMASYNRVNGNYSGYSKEFVRDILKDEWGFRGWVVSDWFAKGNTLSSPVAGLDVEMPFSSGQFPVIFDSQYFYGSSLVTALNNGLVDEKLIDEAVLRILHGKVHAGVLDRWNETDDWEPWLTKSEENQALALEAARQGIVLLRNGPTAALDDDVLPLDRDDVGTLAVVGKFAYAEHMGDKGSSDAKVVDGELVITPWEGFHEALGAENAARGSCGGAAKCVLGFETLPGNEAAVGAADVVVVVAAYYYADLARSPAGEEGEWKDRVSMRLPQRDLDTIAGVLALRDANPDLRVVVVMKSGGAVVVDPWAADVDALLMAWYGGMREGTALAELVFGDVNPGGKLVQSFPVAESDLPAFENETQGDVVYGYYHGYRWLDRADRQARFPFGFGLSYTTFSYGNLRIEDDTIGPADTLTFSVDVTNTGPRTGSEVVQAYVGYESTAVNDRWGRPVQELEAFARVEDLAPGETRTVTLTLNAADLAYWDAEAGEMTVERMAYSLHVGPSSDRANPDTQTGTFDIE